MVSRTAPHAAFLAVLTVASVLAVHAPFLLNSTEFLGVPIHQTGPQVPARYLDGPLYAVVSQTFYSPSPVYSFDPEIPREYYAAHLILYPASIRILSLAFGPFDAMLLATAVFAVLAVLAFYFLVRDFGYSRHPLLLSSFFVFFPARWLVYHSVGATEPAFIFLSIASLYFFKKGRFFPSALLASLAMLTRITGILLFAFYLVYFLWKRRNGLASDFLPYLLIPAALAAHFFLYLCQFGDFFAYFAVNNYLLAPPLSIVYYGNPSYGEFAFLLYALYAAGTVELFRQRRHDLFLLSLLFVLPTVFLFHNDLSRYLLPAAPFALLIAFEPLLTSKEFRPVLAILAVTAVFYAWSVIPYNLLPASEFEALKALIK
ncbi:MAG: hypothetical protein V1708_04540 [Candidatus Micrarchaeota archaeon]